MEGAYQQLGLYNETPSKWHEFCVCFSTKDGILFEDYIDFSSLYPSYLSICYW